MLAFFNKNKIQDDIDILFLYRTRKKKHYFNFLMGSSFADLKCRNFGYHSLPGKSLPAPKLEKEDIQRYIQVAEQELFNGRPENKFKLLKKLLLWVRKRQLLAIYPRLYSLIKHVNPKLILIWNGHKYQDIILEIANRNLSIPVAYFENGLLPNSTTLDFKGINALNSVPREASFYLSRPSANEQKWQITGRKYLRDINEHQPLPQRYLLVPLQKDRDSQVIVNSTWVKSMVELFSVVTQALKRSGIENLHVVFRPHPSAKTEYPEILATIENTSNLHWNFSAPLAESIEQAVATITINSSVGMESILMGKKVILLGDAYYDIEGLRLKANNIDELIQHLQSLPTFEPNIELRNKFIDYLQSDYVVTGDWQKANSEHAASVREKVNQNTSF